MTEKISHEAIDDFLTFSFLVSKNCSNGNCLVQNFLNTLRKKIDLEENIDKKIKFSNKHCKENIPVFFTLEHNYASRRFLYLTEVKSVYGLQLSDNGSEG